MAPESPPDRHHGIPVPEQTRSLGDLRNSRARSRAIAVDSAVPGAEAVCGGCKSAHDQARRTGDAWNDQRPERQPPRLHDGSEGDHVPARPRPQRAERGQGEGSVAARGVRVPRGGGGRAARGARCCRAEEGCPRQTRERRDVRLPRTRGGPGCGGRHRRRIQHGGSRAAGHPAVPRWSARGEHRGRDGWDGYGLIGLEAPWTRPSPVPMDHPPTTEVRTVW